MYLLGGSLLLEDIHIFLLLQNQKTKHLPADVAASFRHSWNTDTLTHLKNK